MDNNKISNQELYKEWILKANLDYQAIQQLYFGNNYPILFEIICYHCQQSAEKILKSFLALNGEKIKRTHDLIELCTCCISIDPTFENIINYCDELNDYSVITRYPTSKDLEVGDFQTKNAIDNLENIYKFFKEKNLI